MDAGRTRSLFSDGALEGQGTCAVAGWDGRRVLEVWEKRRPGGTRRERGVMPDWLYFFRLVGQEGEPLHGWVGWQCAGTEREGTRECRANGCLGRDLAEETTTTSRRCTGRS